MLSPFDILAHLNNSKRLENKLEKNHISYLSEEIILLYSLTYPPDYYLLETCKHLIFIPLKK